MKDDLPLRWDERIVLTCAAWMVRHVKFALFLMFALLLMIVALFFGGFSDGRLPEPVL